MNDLLLRWTIRVALVLYGLLLTRKIVGWRAGQRLERWWWTLGLAAILAHFLAAYAQLGWSHEAVLAHTARETERVTGWRFAGGVWGNYLFALFWGLETIGQWWRRGWVTGWSLWNYCLHGYLLLVVVNGAIVFATGPVRVVALFVCLVLGGLLFWRWNQNRGDKTRSVGPLLPAGRDRQNGSGSSD